MHQGDKVAIVTRASMGIGQASAKALHQVGFRVFGTSRRAIASVSEGIAIITCDVTDDASVKKAVEKCPTRRAGLTFWSTTPGSAWSGGAEESSIEQAQALFDVNLFGVMRATNAVLPTMRNQKAAEDHQYKFGPWPDTCPVLGPLFVYEACPRRLFGVPRSRGAELRHSSLLARVRVHWRFLRAEHRAS